MIKKFTKTLFVCLLACGSAFAQKQYATETNVNSFVKNKVSHVSAKINSTCVDTLNMPFTGTPTLYRTAAPKGYVSGNNQYGDLAKAEYFNNYTPFTHITGAVIYFGHAVAASPSSSVNIRVWDNTGTGGSPGVVLATKNVTISSIAANITANQPTAVSFTTPVAITGNFYVGVSLSTTTGDTVAIITNRHNDAPANKAWELLSNNTWATYTSGWTLNVNHAIFPIVSSSATGTGVQPTAAFTVTGGTNICANTPVTFNSSTSTGAVTYSWSFPGGTPASSTSANPSVTYAAAGNYNATLTVTDGCSLTNTFTRTNAVTVKTSPTTAVTPTAPLLCGPNPPAVTLTASGASSYSWSPATGLNKTTGATVSATPAVSTMYTVTGTTNGCSSTAQVYVAVYNVVASFTAPDTAYIGATVQFNNTSTGNAGNTWLFGDGNTSGVANPTHVYNAAGKYKVRLTRLIANCTKTFDKDIVIRSQPIGLSEAFNRGEVSVFPNPAQDYLQVNSSNENTVKNVVLLNAVGQEVLSEKIDSGQARLDIAALPAGIYFVTMSNSEGSVTRKISIVR